MSIQKVIGLIGVATLTFSGLANGQTQVPNDFTAGQPALAAEVNANFDALETAIDQNATAISQIPAGPEGPQGVQGPQGPAGQSPVITFVDGGCRLSVDGQLSAWLCASNNPVTIDMTGDWLVSYAADQCQTYSHEGIANFFESPFRIELNSYRCPPNVTASLAYWTLTGNYPSEMTRLELTEMLRDLLNMNTVTVVMFEEDFISWHIEYSSDCSGPNNLDCGIFELTRNP